MKTKIIALLFVVLGFTTMRAQTFLNVNINSTNATSCSLCNGTATAIVTNGTPPYTYTWSNGATTSSISNLCPGNYWCLVTDLIDTGNFGYCTIGPIITDSLVISPTSCSNNNGSATIYMTSGTAPYTYAWSNGATSSSIVGLSTGTYTINVTDAGGCTLMDSAVINSQGLTDSLFMYPSSCIGNNGSAVIHVTGGTPPYTYMWSNGNTTDSIGGLSAGTYNVTVTSGSCTLYDSISVYTNSSLADYISETDASCSLNNGSATANTYGGIAPYTYAWSNGATTASINNLSAGTYTVTITDNGGCSINDQVTINSVGMSLYVYTVPAYCNNNDGIAIAYPGGGSPPYTYLWSNGATTDTVKNLSAGVYTVTVSSSPTCYVTDSVTIDTAYGIPVYATMLSGACVGNNGAAAAEFFGGTPPYTYAWSPTGGSSDTALNLSAGTYTVTVTDAHGCSGSGSVSIYNTNAFTFTNTYTQDTGTCNGSIMIVLNAVPSNYLYYYTYYSVTAHTWEHGYTFNDTIKIDSLCFGPYTVYISTDSQYCALPDNFYILGPSGVPSIMETNVDFKVYPVPANDQLMVEMENSEDKVCNMAIYDMLGKQVSLSENVNIERGAAHKLDVSKLAEGQYMLRVYSDKYSKTVPFVITR